MRTHHVKNAVLSATETFLSYPRHGLVIRGQTKLVYERVYKLVVTPRVLWHLQFHVSFPIRLFRRTPVVLPPLSTERLQDHLETLIHIVDDLRDAQDHARNANQRESSELRDTVCDLRDTVRALTENVSDFRDTVHNLRKDLQAQRDSADQALERLGGKVDTLAGKQTEALERALVVPARNDERLDELLTITKSQRVAAVRGAVALQEEIEASVGRISTSDGVLENGSKNVSFVVCCADTLIQRHDSNTLEGCRISCTRLV